MQIDVAGERLHLLPQRAAYLPAHRCLLVADAHIGKAVSFRRLGVPVPEATTEGTLRRLDAALAATGAQRIVFLGDLLHAARGRAAGTLLAVQAWREGRADLRLQLVRGNHDRGAGDPPAEWGIESVDEPWPLGGLLLKHHPEPEPGGFVLAGHLHPGARLGGRARDSLRLPCFHIGPRVGVLPAFGEFTGLHVMPREPGTRVWVVLGDEVRELPSASRSEAGAA